MKQILLMIAVVALVGCGTVEKPKRPKKPKRPTIEVGEADDRERRTIVHPNRSTIKVGEALYYYEIPYPQLDLSEEQQESLKDIERGRIVATQKLFEELRGGESGREAMQVKYKEMRKKFEKQSEVILTDAQKKKLAGMPVTHKKWFKKVTMLTKAALTADYGPKPTEEEILQLARRLHDQRLIDPTSGIYRVVLSPQRGYTTGFGGTAGVEDTKFGWLVLIGINARNRFGGYAGEKAQDVMLIKNGRVVSEASAAIMGGAGVMWLGIKPITSIGKTGMQ